MPITDYNTTQFLDVTSQNDSGTTQDKAQPILLADGTFFDLSKKSFLRSFDHSADATFVGDVEFNDDGSKMYLLDNSGASQGAGVYSYTLSTRYDVSTASQLNYFSTVQARGLAFNNDGSKMYIAYDGTVESFSLSTNFDITTASSNNTFDISSQTTSALGLDFNKDGSKIYVAGDSNIYSYSLSTNFDITTASSLNTFDVSSEDGTPSEVKFNNDGSKMFVLGFDNASVFQYDLSTDFDISTATFNQSTSVSSEDSSPLGLTFDGRGSKMYVAGETNDNIFEYLISDEISANGDIVIDFTNIADAQDIAVYDQNGNLLDYEIEELDMTNNTAVLWAYSSWTRDDTVQAQVAYGDNSANTDRQNVTGTWNNTGQNAEYIQHLNEPDYPTDDALDSSPNQNDASVTGATSTSLDLNGAISLDGTDDEAVASNTDTSTDQWTVSSIVEPNLDQDVNARYIYFTPNFEGSETGASMDIGTNNELFGRIQSTDGDQIVGNFAASSSTTYLTVFKHTTADDYEFYVDGSLNASANRTASLDQPLGNETTIGSRSRSGGNDSFFGGEITEVQIHSGEKSVDWIQAFHDASPKAGQVYFSQQAAQQTTTNQTASIPVTQNTQTTPAPQVQAGAVAVSTPTTVLTQTTENPQVQPGTATLTVQETQLTAVNPDINLQPGESRLQVTTTALAQTTENPAVNATFDLSVPETQLTATNPDPSITLAEIVLVPETQLNQSAPNIQLQPGDSPVAVPETQLTQTTPEVGLNRRIVFGVVTQLNASNPEPNLEPGIVQVNVAETQLTQTTESPQVEPGEATVQVTPPTQLTVFTPDTQVTPGNTDLQIDETVLLQTTPELNLGLDLQFVSPTNALITNNNRYFDMPDHTFKQNDFGDTFTATLKDDDNPNGVSIQGNTGVTLVVETADGEKVLDKEMTVTDAANGKVKYEWETGDFIEDVGVYKAEIKVFDASDEPETFPNNSYRSVTVEDELE